MKAKRKVSGRPKHKKVATAKNSQCDHWHNSNTNRDSAKNGTCLSQWYNSHFSKHLSSKCCCLAQDICIPKVFSQLLTSFVFSCSSKCWGTLFKAHSAYWTCVAVKSSECHKFSSHFAPKAQFKVQFTGLKRDSYIWSSIHRPEARFVARCAAEFVVLLIAQLVMAIIGFGNVV